MLAPVQNRPNVATSSAVTSRAAQTTAAARATPTPPGQPNTAYDGNLIGGNGQAYPPGTALADVPPTRPSNGPGRGTLIFVNGIGESRAGNKAHLQEMANGTGMNVVGLYNATQGSLKDLVQALKDKNDLGTNHAVDALADVVYSELQAGRPVRIAGHSQGALITSRALTDVKNRLMLEDGLTEAQAEAKLRNVGVETMGGAATSYPDGPRYVHYVNRADLVPMAFGLGAPNSDPGKGAKVVKFGFPNPFGIFGSAHSTSTYFKHYEPFPGARVS